METILQLNFGQLITSTILLAILFSVFQWLIALWIKARLEKSIQHEYDKKLEDYKFSQLQRQRVSLIADFFARWIKYRGKEKEFLDEKELISYYEDLNRMSLEISMWVQDEKLLNELMSLLRLEENAPDVRILTGKVRKLILKMEDDKFDPQKIIIWPNSEIEANLFKK